MTTVDGGFHPKCRKYPGLYILEGWVEHCELIRADQAHVVQAQPTKACPHHDAWLGCHTTTATLSCMCNMVLVWLVRVTPTTRLDVVGGRGMRLPLATSQGLLLADVAATAAAATADVAAKAARACVALALTAATSLQGAAASLRGAVVVLHSNVGKRILKAVSERGHRLHNWAVGHGIEDF